MYFRYFFIISTWKWSGTFIWTNFLHLNKLESLSPKDALWQVWLKLAQWFWRRRFLNFVNVFCTISLFSPVGKGRGHSFEETWIPFTQGYFVQSLEKLAQWFWRKEFFNFINVFSLFHNYLPWKKVGSFIWKNLNLLHPRMLCAKFGWNWLSRSGEEDENVKSLQKDGQTNRQTIRKAHLSFQLRWAKNLTGCFTGLHCL